MLNFMFVGLMLTINLAQSSLCPNHANRVLRYYIVSDLTDRVRGPSTPNGANAVEITGNDGWTCDIPGAIWIWDSNPVSVPSVDQTVYYYKEFFIPGIPVYGSFQVCGDNKIWTYINGEPFGCDNLSGSWWSGSEKTCDVLSKLRSGYNTLNITVTNIGDAGTVPGTGTNPAGARYKLAVSYSIDDDGVSDIDDVDDYDD